MKIAAVGGMGTIGRRIIAALSRDGHEVRTLSRTAPQYVVDLTTRSGLEAALADCEVVIDARNSPPLFKARAVLVDRSRRLPRRPWNTDIRGLAAGKHQLNMAPSNGSPTKTTLLGSADGLGRIPDDVAP
jgi:hypothetical protein